MPVRIAVAGGHTKATAVALTSEAPPRVLGGAEIQKGLNLHSRDHCEVATRFKDLMDVLGVQTSYSGELHNECDSICFTLPGAATKPDQLLAETVLSRAGWWSEKMMILDDTWAGLIGGASSCRGICAFAGTGASVFVGLGDFAVDRARKIDGWGAFLGDRGSGFQLAMNALRSIAREYDGGTTVPLAQAFFVSEKPKLSSVAELQKWFDDVVYGAPTEWNVEIGKLAILITTRAADAGVPDTFAADLVKEVARQMAETICLAVRRFGPDATPLPIVLQGGMFEHSLLYRNTVTEAVRRDIPNSILMARGRPLYGAAAMVALGSRDVATGKLLPPSDDALQQFGESLEIPPDCLRFLYY